MPRPEHAADRAAPSVVVADERSSNDSPDCPVDVDRWERLAVDVLTAECGVGELTLTFIDRADIAELNAEYMGKPGPTDVLSFPLDDDPMPTLLDESPPVLLGDIVLSPSVANDQYAAHAGTYDDEIALLVVHGVLHILGHDHADPAETALMRAREIELLSAHHWGGPPPAGFRQDHDD